MSSKLSKRAAMLAEIAENAIAAGMGIIAIKPRSKSPDTRFSPHGLNSATKSLKTVKRWLAQDGEINLAAGLKGSGICVVDEDGPEAATALKRLAKLPPTRKTRTRKGSHRFYRYSGNLGGSVIKFAVDLDFLLSSYVLLPGSRHPDGGIYSSKDFGAPIADLPNEVVKAIRKHRSNRSKRKGDMAQEEAGAIKVTKGGRNSRLTQIAGSIRRQGYSEPVIFSLLDTFNRKFCEPPLPTSEVESIAGSISRYDPAHEGLFTLMSDVTPRAVEFLWKPYFVRGAVNLLEGDGNVGKTYFLCWLAALLSSGRALPGQEAMDPQGFLFLSAEDDPETTLFQRFTRMGGDLSRIWVMKYLPLNEDVIMLIEEHIKVNGVKVISIDPLLAYMQGVDMNKANETRPFMARLGELARDHNVTVIGLRHLNKSDKDKAIHRGLGSVDISAAARSSTMIGLHPDDEDIRVFAHSKHNLSVRGDSRLYTLDGETKTRVPRLVWCGTTDLTANDLGRKPNPPGRPASEGVDAEQFLKRALANGARPVKDVIAEGDRRSINPSTLRKVARRMGVEKRRRHWKLAETPL
ncbi:AAA family ATPase [Sandarakinorhabdus oryzae]|uniref:AAA family ATPase n=1 Tax=Sandarakinorhabdus oryzae TaxID=2675220 RepID=UPI0012E1B81B|nr:AAA family ATPase [Sandarakinorhabdus oryzae]